MFLLLFKWVKFFSAPKKKRTLKLTNKGTQKLTIYTEVKQTRPLRMQYNDTHVFDSLGKKKQKKKNYVWHIISYYNYCCCLSYKPHLPLSQSFYTHLLSVGVMLPFSAVLSAAWIDVDPVSCRQKQRQTGKNTHSELHLAGGQRENRMRLVFQKQKAIKLN